MFRYLFEHGISFNHYRLLLQYNNRFLNKRMILSILFLLFLFFIWKIWSDRIAFGQYKYVFAIERIIEARSSRFHNTTVAQSGSLRMLRFSKSDIQGVIDLENPYVILFDYMRLQLLCLLWNPEPEHILIIGLGANILPKIIHYISANTLIDIVEIDSVIVDLARKYFYLEENNFIQIHVEEGRHFIERQRSNQYDIIIVDVSINNGHIPHTLRTLECFGEYLRILKSTGLVVVNFPYEQESRYRQTFVRALFKYIYRGITKDNYILIGLNKQAKIFNQNDFQLKARTLQQSKTLPDMIWTEEIQYIHDGNDDKWNISATIFTD